MANEIQVAHRATGKTLYAVIRNNIGQVWQTTTNTFVAYASANLANYDVALTEQGTASRFFSGAFPSAIAAGIYFVAAYERGGGSPDETDLLAGDGVMYWDGSAVADMDDFKASTTTPPTVAAIADAVWDEPKTGHTTSGTFGEGVDMIAISGDSTAADNLEAMLDGTGGVSLILTNFDDFKADVNGLSTFDPITDAVIVAAVNTDAISADAIAAGAANEIADALLDRTDGVESSYTVRQALRLVLAAAAGKLSGAGGLTVVIRDVNDARDRITASVDANGNRTAVTTDVS